MEDFDVNKNEREKILKFVTYILIIAILFTFLIQLIQPLFFRN